MSVSDPLAERARRAVAELPDLLRGLRLAWNAAPRLAAAWLAVLSVQGLLPVALVELLRLLVDALVAAAGAGGGWARAARPLLLTAVMAGLLVLLELLAAVSRWQRAALAELVRDHIAELVHTQATRLDLAYYESPEYHDQLHRIRYDVRHRPLVLLEQVGAILRNALTLLAMVAVLARFGPWIPVALVASTLPALWAVLRRAVREHRWRLEATPRERRTLYLDWVLTSLEAAPEVRLFGLAGHLREAYRRLRAGLRREWLGLVREDGVRGVAAGALGLAVTGVALGVMVWRALEGRVTLGEVAMFYQAFSQGQRLMRSLLESVGQVASSALFMGVLFDFLERKPRVRPPERPAVLPAAAAHAVRFRGVRFSYPGVSRPVLDGFDLEVPAGTMAAVVGPNGAGKSTLIKLLCRFYDPDEGTVALDGVDLKQLDPEEVRGRIAVLFQVPMRFNATVRENIAYGDLERAAEAGAVEAAARAAGAEGVIARLPSGYDTLLGKWFAGGAELSVGEWQRLALARAFLRPAPVMLLDEPTSAMDSWAEAEWIARFRVLARGRTVLLITHRFTTARLADVIHVMEAGRIVESGTHEALLAAGGRYAASWRRQVRGEVEG